MKKVVIFYPFITQQNAFSGGVAKVVIANIISLISTEYEPHLILNLNNQGLIHYVEKHYCECKIHPVNVVTPSYFSDSKGLTRAKLVLAGVQKFIKSKRCLSRIIKEISPEIIHYHEVVCLPFLSIKSKAKKILHIHSYRFTSYHITMYFLKLMINKNVDLIISPTFSIFEKIKTLTEKKLIVLPTPYYNVISENENILDDDVCEKLQVFKKNGKIIFSFVGRICKIKRIDHFLHAISSLSPEIKEKFVFAIMGTTNTNGDIQYYNLLLEIIKQNNLTNVYFLGYVNVIEDALKYVDLGVVLTESEALPMAILEYMQMNIPVLGYDVAGIKDVLLDSQNGFLIENGNIQKLTETLMKSITDQSYVDNIRIGIHKLTLKYEQQIFSESINNLYQELLSDICIL